MRTFALQPGWQLQDRTVFEASGMNIQREKTEQPTPQTCMRHPFKLKHSLWQREPKRSSSLFLSRVPKTLRQKAGNRNHLGFLNTGEPNSVWFSCARWKTMMWQERVKKKQVWKKWVMPSEAPMKTQYLPHQVASKPWHKLKLFACALPSMEPWTHLWVGLTVGWLSGIHDLIGKVNVKFHDRQCYICC